ncbi:MAG: NAD(P)/FAD-dependent oxidoreductase [Rhodobacterales bacterium]|nr:NAD(P)/FAD-dependent oxidoreductase [Rhodobacterales bacterium]
MTTKGMVFDCDVVVVGAGAAGLAATGLLRASDCNVLCVEAADRIGGRVHTDTAIFGVPFDMGAHWLHNEHINAFKAPGLALGLDLYPAPKGGVTHGLANDATLWDAVDDLYAAGMQAAQEDAEAAAKSGQPTDRSLADIRLDHGDWSFTARMMFALSLGRDLPDISVQDTSSWAGGDDWFCRQGFGHLVARLAEGLPVRLSTPVTDIQVQPDGVKVKTRAGEIRARAVIVTASVGVLAEDVIRFDPPLDTDRRRALDYITMGDYNHAALMFKPGTIPTDPDIWLTYQLHPNSAGIAQGGGFLCNIAGTGLTAFETSGSFSRDLQAAGPKAAIEHGLDTLAGIFGSGVKQGFLKGHATAWRNEPFTRGSYAGARPGGHGYRKVLARAHAERVHFAGEALNIGQQCTVSGAHLEGLRAAHEVMAALRSSAF